MHAQAPLHATQFDVYYYDQLGRQDETIRLTVDTQPRTPPPAIDDQSALIPPIDLVIRTKWSGAAVDWNGSEPIL